MTPNRCGDCRTYEATHQMPVGRWMGICHFTPTWPKSVIEEIENNIFIIHTMYADNVEPCPCWEAKEGAK